MSPVPTVLQSSEISPYIHYDVQLERQTRPSLLRISITFDVSLITSGASAAVTPNNPSVNRLKTADEISLEMPVWSPGDYSVQNFGKYVRDLVAYDAGGSAGQERKKLTVRHGNANTWTIDPGGAKRITVTYALPETPPGNFSENVELRDQFAFVNGASALLYMSGHKNLPAILTVHLPEGWQAEMPLPVPPTRHLPGQDSSTVTFNAQDYDTLADSPLVMGAKEAIRTTSFKLEGYPNTTYRQVYFGDPAKLAGMSNLPAYAQMLERMARAETRIMGGPTGPLYEFCLEVGGRGGGLEHLNSFRAPLWANEAPEQAAAFFAHEFFHQWNIKRIRPRVLGPFDYIHPPHTHNLWFAEGVTDYYAWVAIRRAGLRTPAQFYSHWRQSISRMQRNPARLTISADQASWQVWEAGSSDGAGGLSYYEKGALIGLCLDLKIRHVTKNQRSLDDVMRLLLAKTAPPHPGYDEDDLRTAINTVIKETKNKETKEGTDQDLTPFYNLLARSTQEMPYAECLAYAGLDASLLPKADATPEQIALRKEWAGE